MVLEKKYITAPQTFALIHRQDLEFNNIEIVSVGDKTVLGRWCAFRDYGTQNNPRSIVLGRKCWVGRFVEFAVWDNNHVLLKGDTSINDGTKIYGSVTIEKYCLIAPNVFISSGNHHAHHSPPILIKDQDTLVQNAASLREHDQTVHIEEDCWIGLGAFLKQGIYVGRGAIIGTYSVVLTDVPPYSVQVGAPSREIKTRLLFEPPDELRADQIECRPYFYRGFYQRLSDISESLKRGVILADHHTVITLRKRSRVTLRISGKLSLGIRSVRIRLRLNGHFVAALIINESAFEHEVNMTDMYQAGDEECVAVAEPLKRFNVYTLDASEILDDKCPPHSRSTPYGFSVIQQIPCK